MPIADPCSLASCHVDTRRRGPGVSPAADKIARNRRARRAYQPGRRSNPNAGRRGDHPVGPGRPGAGGLRTSGAGLPAPRVRARVRHPARPRRRRGPGPGGVREALAGAAPLRRPRAGSRPGSTRSRAMPRFRRCARGAARCRCPTPPCWRKSKASPRRRPRSPTTQVLRRQIETLPEKQRQAVTLYYLDERTGERGRRDDGPAGQHREDAPASRTREPRGGARRRGRRVA